MERTGMYRIDPIGIAGAFGMGAAGSAYMDPADLSWLPVIGATLLGATINVLRQIKKGGDKVDAAIAGLLAVMLGLFLAQVFGGVLKEFIPGLEMASATAMAGVASTFGVGYALKLLEHTDKGPK